jgi:XTP/dITP diphosphohydrolase
MPEAIVVASRRLTWVCFILGNAIPACIRADRPGRNLRDKKHSPTNVVFRLVSRQAIRQMKRLPMTTLLLATRNTHKIAEIRAILGDGFRYLTLKDFPDAPPVVEDADSFAGNATKKAVELAKWLGSTRNSELETRKLFVLADDSGLEVDVLDGAPGIHSARFASLDSGKPGNSPDADNNAKLLRLLQGVPLEKRTARFHCVIALTPALMDRMENASPVCYADEFEMQTQLFDGACAGHIQFAPSGQGGFGYDPLFVPGGFTKSFAELGEDVKNGLSHRANALRKLKDLFAKNN